MQREKSENKEAGFTLLELLISVTLIGIIVVITAGAMQIGSRSVAAGERKAESLERLRTSMRIIDAHIQSAFFKKNIETGLNQAETPAPPAGTASDQIKEGAVMFKGERSRLEFPSHYSIWGDEGGYVMVAYRVDTGERDRKTLVAAETHPVTGRSRETKLIGNARDIFFEFFYKGPTDEKGEWVEEWTSEETIPGKIRVTVDNGTGPSSLIVPLRVGSAQATTGIVAGGAE
ncbi:MAG: prepilin-type N-terminal cleavage/methylation domain-containing protein [Nitrospirota bacterium]